MNPAARSSSSWSDIARMTSLVDSEAHLRKRAEEMMMSDRGIRALLAGGQPGVPIVAGEFDTFSQDVLGAMASIGDRAVLKRLLIESQLKEQVTNPEAAQS